MLAARLALALLTLSMLGAFGCGGHSIPGTPCSASDPCPDRYTCVTAFDGQNRCMQDCTTDETVCPDGRACLPLTSGTGGVCYLGGNVSIGSNCSGNLECTRGAICVAPLTGGQAICLTGCNLDGSEPCAGGQPCNMTVQGSGYCGAH